MDTMIQVGSSTAAAAVIDVVEDVAARFHLGVAHDDPYRGGHTTVRYGRPAAGMHAIQIELSRKLYMDEETGARLEGFASVQSRLAQALRRVIAFAEELA